MLKEPKLDEMECAQYIHAQLGNPEDVTVTMIWIILQMELCYMIEKKLAR